MRGLTHSETDKDWGFITSWALLQKKHPDKPSPFLWATHQQHPTMHCGWENSVVWLDNIQAANRGGGYNTGSRDPNHKSWETMAMICYQVRLRMFEREFSTNEMLSVFFFASLAPWATSQTSFSSFQLLYFTSFFTSTGKTSHTLFYCCGHAGTSAWPLNALPQWTIKAAAFKLQDSHNTQYYTTCTYIHIIPSIIAPAWTKVNRENQSANLARVAQAKDLQTL